MAQAMEAEEATGAGLASVRCGEPGSDIWFVGPGQQGGAAQIQLDLMNIDALPASVDVNVITDAGPVQAGGDTGITVPPHETVTESLSSLAAGSSVVAIEVRTSIGRVAADVSESSAARRDRQLAAEHGGAVDAAGDTGSAAVGQHRRAVHRGPRQRQRPGQRPGHHRAGAVPPVRHADGRPAGRLRLLRPAHASRRHGGARAHGERARHRRRAGAGQRPGRLHRGHRAHQRAGRRRREHHRLGPERRDRAVGARPARPGSA